MSANEKTQYVKPLYTIGHSNHQQAEFCALLERHRIEVLVDVRSQPFSRFSSQFNKNELQAALRDCGIRYLFMGHQLGGRPEGEQYYDQAGHVLYHRVAESDFFLAGIERLIAGTAKMRVAIMCSEEDPGVCHRFLLVTRVLEKKGVGIQHIRGDGSLATEEQIRRQSKDQRDQGTLFAEMRNDTWKSLQSVLPKVQPPTFSGD